MNHEQYKEMCLAIKNDVSFDEFASICSFRNYTKGYVLRIWQMYSRKPLDFVLYHHVGRDVFEYLRLKQNIIDRIYQP